MAIFRVIYQPCNTLLALFPAHMLDTICTQVRCYVHPCTNKYFNICFHCCSALLTYQGSGKARVLPPGDLCEVESLQREVTEFEERTRTFIKTKSRLPALPTDENMEESSKVFPSLDKSTAGNGGSTSVSSTTPFVALAEAKMSSLVYENSGKGVVSNVDSGEKMIGISAASLSDKQGSSSAGILNEIDKNITTNGKTKYDLNTVKIQMKQINSDSIDMTKLVFLETKCNRVLEKFDLNALYV